MTKKFLISISLMSVVSHSVSHSNNISMMAWMITDVDDDDTVMTQLLTVGVWVNEGGIITD